MRIISGTARGTKLFTLEGQTTRPTLDRVKESIFNIIQSQIINSNFLDVFSGSGAIGLEAAQGQNPTEEEKATASSSEQVKKAVESINRSQTHTEAIFGIHEGTNRVTIKIVDKESKKVIKEYPPEKTLDMIQKLWEMAGLMVDEKR